MSITHPLWAAWQSQNKWRCAASFVVAAVAPYLATTIVLLALWYYASTLLNPVFFPSPLAVLRAAYDLLREGVLVEHVLVSMARILIGFAIGSMLAVPLGLLMGMYPFAARLLTPYVGFPRFVPPISMSIFAIAWFGSSEFSKIFLVAFATVFVVTLNVEAGTRSVATNRIRAALCLGATQLQLFLHVMLPSSVPYILTGMRVAMGNAFAVIIAAELLSSEEGIGFLLENSRAFLQTDRIFVAIVTLGVMGFVTDRCFRILIRLFGGEYAR